ncbi:MAG: TIGR01777 family protein [Sulfurimonas sp.]|nr:TIGR01777 family protein [Sulfurimonas sp.]MBU1216953.1 TIGR01777 family oxidoreductase [bacterium]MBU1435080.1 TIGR01777 family oxidoreductase [bacterium]MBU1504185.1 TIGR01777 family oxidoreductase [bacterium]MBU3938175.1 TIGR01777 family oxidoreductase [bacterium]
MKVAITGASGFVGSHLTKTFTDFVSIHRNDTEDEILAKLQGVDVVFNLAGAPIIKKWSESYKKILISSRVDTTKTLVNAINRSEVKQLISTSAIGAYPDNAAFDEYFEGYGDDFLASLTQMWEAEALACNKPTAIIRFGVILGHDGGALAQMLPPFKLGLGGIIGNGKMMTSWIDVDDLVRIYAHVIENELTGTFNATAPEPVSNYDFTKALGKVLNRPTIFPLPEFVLKLLFGEGSTVLTGSKEVYPKALLESGFKFHYPDIDSSFSHILS